ncbi:MAG TPA: CvpA family protein, partial [Tepidisphaeraceae bacterium]
MILSAAVIVLVIAIAYFHYVQGFFSATISAILAILSGVIAISYFEPLTRMLNGKAGDQGEALVLVALFAVVYTILRVIFDAAIPGNIRLPVLLDKIGAGAAGLFAGIFAIGILIVAAQTLAFGPSIGGYARYGLVAERDVQIPSSRQAQDSAVYDELKSDEANPEKLDPSAKGSLILPVDDIVINMTAHLSDGGSLAGPVDMLQVHPSYLDELFADRLGIQTGAKHTALNTATSKDVDVQGLYTTDALPQAEAEIPAIRKSDLGPLRSDQSKIILIARLNFNRNASDDDSNVRVSTGAVRLVANQTDYNPIGTLDATGTPTVRVNHLDDFLIVPAGGSADFVFAIPRDDLGVSADKKNSDAPLQIGSDVFIEVKRNAIVDLSGQSIKRELPPPGANIRRKTSLPAPKPMAGVVTPAPMAVAVPFEFDKLQISSTLFTDINVGRYDSDSATLSFPAGTVTLREKKFAKLEVNPSLTLAQIGQGDYLVREFWTPPTARLVEAFGAPPSRSDSPWDWADNLSKFELIDASGKSYRP